MTLHVQTNVARAAVILDGRRFGTLPCPVCKLRNPKATAGVLRFTVSGAGFVNAYCNRKGCVDVQE